MTQSNQTAQTMEDGLKSVNLFDAVPYIAQTRLKMSLILMMMLTFKTYKKVSNKFI